MAFIQNIVSKFQTTGAKESAAATNTVGKAQTRLAQSSASAGRSFAAQSQGLGGVVGVYAAAAANVFALTAAFTALNRAAQFETIISGTNQLALAVGASGEEVVRRLKDITDGQLSIVEAATQSNLALSAGFNTEQIEQLGDVANKASKALGRNLTDAFQRITRGAIKLEPELLDEIGIFTRIEPAVEAYAAQLNKSVATLTQFERRQAFVNQVIKDGQAAFSEITVDVDSTQVAFEKLVADFSDLAIKAGKLIADGLTPLAKFLGDNLGNQLLLLSSIGLLVFGKLKQVIGAFATTSLVNLATQLSLVADNFAKSTVSAETFTAANLKALNAFKGAGALPGAGRASGAELKRQLGAGLSTQQALIAQKEINNLLNNEVNLRDSITSEIRKSGDSSKELTTEFGKSKQRTDALNLSMTAVKLQLASAGKFGKLFAAALNFASAAATKLATIVSAAFGILNAAFIAIAALQIVGSLLDIDFIGAITDAYKKLTQASTDTKNGLEAIQKIAVDGSDKFELLANNLGILGETLAKRLPDALDLLQGNRTLNQLQFDLESLEQQLSVLANFQSNAFSSFFDTTNAELIADLKDQIELLKIALDPTVQALGDAAGVVGQIGRVAEQPFSAVAQSAADGAIAVDKAAESISFSFNGIEIATSGLVKGQSDLDDETLKLLSSVILADTQFRSLQKGLREGTITTAKAEQQFGTIRDTLKRVAEEFKGVEGAEDIFTALNSILDGTIQKTGEEVDKISQLNKFTQQFRKEFSSAFATVDTAVVKGLVSLTGEIAKNGEEQALNQAKLNLAILNTVRNEQAASDISDKRRKDLEAFEAAVIKASQGRLLQLAQSTDKQKIAEEKKLKTLNNQLDVLKKQATVSDIQLQLADAEDIRNRNKNTRNKIVETLEKQAELNKTINDIAEKRNKISVDNLKNTIEVNKQLAKNLIAEERLSRLVGIQQAESGVSQAETALSRAENMGITTREGLINLQREVVLKEFELQKQIIESKRLQALEDLNLEAASLRANKVILAEEQKLQSTKFQNEITALNQEEDIAQTKFLNFIKGLKDEENVIDRREAAALAQFDTDEARIKADIKSRKAEIDLQIKKANIEADTIDALNTIVGENFKILNGYAEVISKLTNTDVTVSVSPGQLAKLNIDSIIDDLKKSKTVLTDIEEERISIAKDTRDKAISAINAERDALIENRNQAIALRQIDIDSYNAKIGGAIQQQAADVKARESSIDKIDAELAGLQITSAEVEQKYQAELESAKLSKNAALENLEFQKSFYKNIRSAIIRVADIVENNFLQAFMQLNDAFVEGTLNAKNFKEGVQEFVSTLVKDVQRAVFEETIAKPASGFLKDQVLGAFGQTSKKGIDEVQLTASGAVPVSLESEANGDSIVATIKGESDSIFTTIGDKLKEFGVNAKDVFSQLGSGILSSLKGVFSSIGGMGSGGSSGGIFSGLFGGISSIFGGGAAVDPGLAFDPLMAFASGGSVRKFAAGGMRDRVPSLLEPGEFVVRKQAAKVAGPSNLAALNATGQMGGGNVSVNVTNTGTPQEASASQPRFDGEKMVIDIVMRDLATNGPIRKSLRAGGAG